MHHLVEERALHGEEAIQRVALVDQVLVFFPLFAVAQLEQGRAEDRHLLFVADAAEYAIDGAEAFGGIPAFMARHVVLGDGEIDTPQLGVVVARHYLYAYAHTEFAPSADFIARFRFNMNEEDGEGSCSVLTVLVGGIPLPGRVVAGQVAWLLPIFPLVHKDGLQGVFGVFRQRDGAIVTQDSGIDAREHHYRLRGGDLERVGGRFAFWDSEQVLDPFLGMAKHLCSYVDYVVDLFVVDGFGGAVALGVLLPDIGDAEEVRGGLGCDDLCAATGDEENCIGKK
ncbi:hypothetical protein PG997_003296 [Apiospora hydei]|uniref:Uncharacterized protein n=1 Tax=Apiospora hydei TaxID=1337664 RepID=A0ABR1WYX0_9PEZI